MKKSLLIASLAVISMNVSGMHPLDHNNPVGNNPGHMLTPDSASIRLTDTNQAASTVDDSNQLSRILIEIISYQQETIRSQQKTIKYLQAQITQNSVSQNNNQNSEVITPSIALFNNEQESLMQNSENYSITFDPASSSVSSLQATLPTPSEITVSEETLNASVPNDQNNDDLTELQQLCPELLTQDNRTDQEILNQDEFMTTVVPENNQVQTQTNENHDYSAGSDVNPAENLSLESIHDDSHVDDFSNTISSILKDLGIPDTTQFSENYQTELSQSSSKRSAPEETSTSQPPAHRRRIDPEAASSSTSHLQQPDNHQEETNPQNDVEENNQNLVNAITLNYWGEISLNPRECIKLFSYLTDPNYEGGITKAYLTKATTAINMWNAITDNEREYLSILARNIHSPLEEFPIQDQERINELETAIRADRNILPGENLKIMVNTGPRECDLIEFVDDVRDRESNIQAARYYKSSDLTKPLITVLAQTNWPAQPCFATEEELNNFEQSVKSFVDEYNQRRSELENSNDPDRDKLVKTNLVSTVLNLRRFGIGDRLIANKLNLFSSNDENEAIQKFKSLYPCLQKGAPFNIARKKTIEVLKWQGKSNKEISAILGMSYGRVYEMWKSINSH